MTLPVRNPRESDKELRPFGEAEGAPPPAMSRLAPKHLKWRVIRDLSEDLSTLEVIKDEGVFRLEDIDWTVGSKTREWYSCQGDDFDSVRGKQSGSAASPAETGPHGPPPAPC